MNIEFVEVLKLIFALLAVIVGYILTGIANNCIVKGEKFDTVILIEGLIKTVTACAALIIVAYVCTIVDLSPLGFEPQTAITSGILVYAAKLIRNAFGLLGLSKFEKPENSEAFEPAQLILDEFDNQNGIELKPEGEENEEEIYTED